MIMTGGFSTTRTVQADTSRRRTTARARKPGGRGRFFIVGRHSVASVAVFLEHLVLDAAPRRDGHAVRRGPGSHSGGVDAVERRLTGSHRGAATTRCWLRRLARRGCLLAPGFTGSGGCLI